MKKILLQKERDEVSAASSGNLPPPVFHSEIPFSRLNNSCLEENKCTVASSDECNRIETPSKEQSRTGTPSIERSRAGRPLQIGSPYAERVRIETPSRSEILKVSSLISGTSMPVPAVPVLMMSPNAEVDLGHDKYYLGSSGSAVFGLSPYTLSQCYQIGDSQLQNVSPTRLLRSVRMKDERYLEESVSRATTSFNIPADSHREESILPLHTKAELQGYTEQYSFDKRSRSLARACESLLEEKRADTDLDSVSSSDTVEKRKNDSMKVVEVDSEDEDTNRRKWRSNALDDIRNDLPRMIDKERHCMWGSPLIVSDGYNHSKKENVRVDSVDTFKSPAVEHQKTISRPKGRPAKMAVGGDVGPGGRSIIRCQICGKLFNNSSALAKHKLTHSDERKYACSLCSKAFKRQDHLNGHMMTHSSTKPFGCKFIGCNKSYCDARSLRRHMENHHQECATAAAAAGSSSSFFNFDTCIPHPFGSDISAEKSGSYLQQVSPISPVLKDGPPPPLSRPFADFSSSQPQCATVWVTGYNPLDEPKPVKCGVCGRGFKNIPALNGHMRLHGGYVRKDHDMDESQDISHGSETHSESRFSLQSESSQSSTSASDHQHDSIMSSGAPISSSGFCAKQNLNGSEPDRRQFLIRHSSTEEEHLHNRRLHVPSSEPKINVSHEDSRYFTEAEIACSSAAQPKNPNESDICNSFKLNHLMQHDTFENGKDEARPQCRSPQNATKHNEGTKRIVEMTIRHAEDEKNNVQVTATTSVDDVQNIANCSTSTMKEPQNKMKHEFQQEKSSNSSCSNLQQQCCKPCKKQRTSVGANDISDAVILTESNAITDKHLVELTGTGCQIGIRPSNQVKSSISCGKKIDGSLTSLPNVAKTGEDEKIQTSGNDYLPDSTSEKEEIDVCRLGKLETCVDGQPKLDNSSYKSGMSQTEIVQKVDNSAVSVACKMHSPSENQEFVHGVPSSQIKQGGCLYRKRWMNLQLKQAGIHYNEHSETTSTSSARDQCSDNQITDGTNTDCGEPPSLKCLSKFGEHVHFQPGMCRSYANENSEANDSVNSHCLPGSHETSFVASRSGQTTPVQHADQSSSLLSKRGSLGMFTYPYVALQHEMTAPVVSGCHSASIAGRECLLRHVHSNSCITQVDDIQSIIPSSPYDLHPHTPCAAHTPYTPCQTYTPHTPYTPVNQPGTPKHASHFEFPPRDYLQERSFCDSPFAAHGSQMQRTNPQLEVCLVVEPENSRYLAQQSLKMADAEIRSGSLHQLCQNESLYRKVVETEGLDKEYLVQHNVLDGSSRSHALTQRKLDLQRLYSGNQGQMQDACHSLIQNEARNPDDGMSASPPIGARYESHLLPNADQGIHFNDKKHDKQMERKRKNSSEIESESDCKRPVVVKSVASGDKILGADAKAKQEDIKAVEVDGDLQKSIADLKSGIIIFRNPPSPLKVKKTKPRPEPLFIPAHVNHIGFQSRLRSPRLWDGLTKQTPPYTPPPMLSPARSGPGLFWTLHSGCHSPISVPPVLSKYGRPKGGKPLTEDAQSVIEFETEPPATDTQPHINIGPQYQPDLPHFQGCKRDFSDCDNHSSLVWNPSIVDKLGDDEMAQYMDYACCAAIPGNGVNKEYALHLLHMCRGDMKRAGKLLLEPEPKLPKSCGLMTYKYQECVDWKKTEIELFHRAIMKVDKDFFQIAKLVSTKTVKDCVQFYYLWKKICPDESKQLKLLRRKREQLELYSRRSKDLHDQPPTPIKSCVQQTAKSCDKMTADSEPKKSVKDNSTELCYQASFGICNTLKEEKVEDTEKHWCSFCKRSFTSARNFSVHMKKHRQSAPGMDSAEFNQAVKLPYPALSSVF